MKLLKFKGVYKDYIWGGNKMREKFGVKTEDCLMFGDNWTDLAAGRNAGFKRVFATYGFGELGQESYDCKAGSFDEFVDMVLSEA